MLADIFKVYSNQIASFQLLLILVGAILHIIFAGAVAKDAADLVKNGVKPILVSSYTWAFATLIGGVFTATIYWVLHHSKLTRG